MSSFSNFYTSRQYDYKILESKSSYYGKQMRKHSKISRTLYILKYNFIQFSL